MKHCLLFVVFLSFYVRIRVCVSQDVYRPAVWADEVEGYIEREDVISYAQFEEDAHEVPNMDDKFGDEVFSKEEVNDMGMLESTVGKSDLTLHNRRKDSEPGLVIKKKIRNQTRQLEAIAFPVGIAIGAIGAALWPAIFPPRKNVTTTTTTQRSNNQDSFQSDNSGTFTTATTTTGTTSTTTTFKPRSVLTDFSKCGEKGSSNRVVGGTEVVENEYPWLCSLKYNDNHICGMTLLSGPPHDTILVGAAHCFYGGDNFYNYRISCGEHSLRGRGEYEVTLQVTEVIVHPKYVEASTSGFDIAVYKVNDAPLNGKMVHKKLWPACLPDIDRDFLRETTYVAGWGITKTKYIQGSKISVRGIPDIARHADVTVTECRDLDQSRYPLGLVCAAESGRDTCQGDSGGPLMGTAFKYSNSTQKRLSWIGIVSYGIGCAEPGFPGAYTRSACFLGFVAEQFGLKADFPAANKHPAWSTDCPNGASRRISSSKRKKHKKHKKNKKNNRHQTQGQGR